MVAGRIAESDRDTYLAATAAFMQSLDETEFPALHRLIPALVNHGQRAQFDAGLELLLDALGQAAPIAS